MVKIWHNNRCSKSNEAKKILEDLNVPHGTFSYLSENIDKNMLLDIMKKLSITDIRDMLRKKETLYKELNIDDKSQDEVISIIIQNHSLIERPIIIKNDKAIIARPMEKLHKLLEKN